MSSSQSSDVTTDRGHSQRMLYPEIKPVAEEYGFRYERSYGFAELSKFSQPFDEYVREATDQHPRLVLHVISGANPPTLSGWQRGHVRGEKVNLSFEGGQSFSSDYVPVEDSIEILRHYGDSRKLKVKE